MPSGSALVCHANQYILVEPFCCFCTHLLFPFLDENCCLRGSRKIAVVKKIANQYQDIDAVLSSNPPPANIAAINDAKQSVP
jgi:hypothetical protein